MDPLLDVLTGLGSTALAYLLLLAAVRVAGRRTVSQMSAFDVVVTIALGSLLAQTSTSGTGLLRGLVGIAVLLALQTLIGWARRHSPALERWVEFSPKVVVRNGDVVDEELAGGLSGPQMTVDELAAMLRGSGIAETRDIRVAILEPTGSLSVLRAGHADGAATSPLWTAVRDERPTA